jgi:hypothetical protein
VGGALPAGQMRCNSAAPMSPPESVGLGVASLRVLSVLARNRHPAPCTLRLRLDTRRLTPLEHHPHLPCCMHAIAMRTCRLLPHGAALPSRRLRGRAHTALWSRARGACQLAWGELQRCMAVGVQSHRGTHGLKSPPNLTCFGVACEPPFDKSVAGSPPQRRVRPRIGPIARPAARAARDARPPRAATPKHRIALVRSSPLARAPRRAPFACGPRSSHREHASALRDEAVLDVQHRGEAPHEEKAG